MERDVKIKKGQFWKEKAGKKLFKITGKSTGMGHWTIKRLDRKNCSHHIHEGTLIKYYQQI